jgi:hypothetical protein
MHTFEQSISQPQAERSSSRERGSNAAFELKPRERSLLHIQAGAGNHAVQRVMQRQLAITQPSDAYEQDADRIASQVMGKSSVEVGGAPLHIQRLAAEPAHTEAAPGSVNRALSDRGAPLQSELRQGMEQRLGADFADVRVHTGPAATQSAQDVNALAYTVGHDVVFDAGRYAPGTSEGQRLVAHELTHVMQQTGSQANMQRKPDPKGSKGAGPDLARNHKRVSMRFDGRHLTIYADDQETFRWSAQSGRPVPLDPKHAAECGVDPVTETYMNNPRLVGIKEFGPIPEGEYRFSAAGIQLLTPSEEENLRVRSHEYSIKTRLYQVPGGDWGNGLVALRPVRLEKGPCGNAPGRTDFFLHGGVRAGSSGCIDIGDEHFAQLANWLQGFPGTITVSVHYEHAAPVVGYFTGFSGMLAYGRQRWLHQPRVLLGTETSAASGRRFLSSATYDAVMQWAGGALSLGARLDVSLGDKDTFVRGGLVGGTNFRLFRGLYGMLTGGYQWSLAGPQATGGALVGGGLEYDFGRVQLSAIHDVLKPASDDARVQQILIGLGIRLP